MRHRGSQCNSGREFESFNAKPRKHQNRNLAQQHVRADEIESKSAAAEPSAPCRKLEETGRLLWRENQVLHRDDQYLDVMKMLLQDILPQKWWRQRGEDNWRES